MSSTAATNGPASWDGRLGQRRSPSAVVAVLALVLVPGPLRSADAGTEFFEAKIRPVLVGQCYACHSQKAREQGKLKGGLLLDTREGLRKGGDSGPAVVPGKAKDSLLLRALEYTGEVAMPPKGKLPEGVIADFRRWVAMGAPDPRTAAASGSQAAASETSWAEVLRERRQWWSLQPVRRPPPPEPQNSWSNHPVDRFVRARLDQLGLEPAPPADKRTLLRRVTFALTGLPPTPQEIDAFLRDDSAHAYARVVDRLLASPRFGERWAGHWMDLVRYAESHGSEQDLVLPHAWRYRDYLVRAFNADVPYDQLLREHVAGDLLPDPRRNAAEGLNESVLGLAHLRMMEHGFQPVDSLDELAKTVENQIDVLTKAFQGLTVACARCHDHKFDAVSQRDYYALFGIFASSRPGQLTVDEPARLRAGADQLAALKARIKAALAEAWLQEAEALPDRLRQPAPSPGTPGADPWAQALADAGRNNAHPLHAWAALRGKEGDDLKAAWRELAGFWRGEVEARRRFNRAHFQPLWDLTAADDYARWCRHGVGLPGHPAAAGEFFLLPEGERVLNGIYPSGVYTHLLSQKHNGVLTSPRFRLPADALSVRFLGEHGGGVRVVVDNYPLGINSTYPQARPSRDEMAWVRLDTSYRKGSDAYVEFATFDDLTLGERPTKENAKPLPVDGRSYLGVAQVVAHNGREPPRDEAVPIVPLLEGEPPATTRELAGRFGRALHRAVSAWRDGRLTDAQAAFLDYFVRRGLLSNSVASLPAVGPLVAEYRRLEQAVPVPRRAPGVLEAPGYDQPLLVRGNHKSPGAAVPRGFLEVLGGRPYRVAQSGRLQLAEDLASPDNPLTARVMVNRLWHWLFGRGLVATVDNFGRLGEPPTHPELLDYLAGQFVEQGWSVKRTIRLLVTSRTFQMSSEASEAALRQDPANVWLSRARVRRLEAEAVRDALLAMSGELNQAMYGPGVRRSPLDDGRRSVYLSVRRNAPHPFLEVFDKPSPATTRGQRDVTNLPAQSLALMNSAFVTELARRWGQKLAQDRETPPDERIRGMFATALGRAPSAAEVRRAHDYLAAAAAERGLESTDLVTDPRPWQDLAQAVFCLKETLYLR